MSTANLLFAYFLGKAIRRHWRFVLLLIALLFAYCVWSVITQ
jgi:hypothetical protein